MILITEDIVSSAFRFVTALVLLPGALTIGRRIRMPWARTAFLVGLLALVASFGMVCIDQQSAGSLPWLRTIRHLTVGVSGVAFAWAAWQVRRHEIADGRGVRR